MSSLKIDEAVRILPEVKYNKAEAMRRVGFTKQGAYAGNNYERLRKAIAKAYNPDTLKAKILKAEQIFIKAEDYSNYARMLELQAKILGLTKEVNAGQQVMVNINDTIDKLRQPKPIDVSNDSI